MTVEELIRGYIGYANACKYHNKCIIDLDGNECSADHILSDKRFASKTVLVWGVTCDGHVGIGTV
ncbi:MAG: hypothetical protein J6O49_16890 [Bacteroidaceae bacterium]|nr:hypothetical protein [Bacteroidaceae bacterium]